MKKLALLFILCAPLWGQFTSAHSIWGRPITPTAPVNGNSLTWNASQSAWVPGAASMGPIFYPESYGARGDGSTDDLTAIQAAINAVPAAGGTVAFQAKTYKVSGTITVSASNLNLIGQGMQATKIINSSTTVDTLDLVGGGTGNCATGGIGYNVLKGFWLQRVTAATSGNGLSISKGCYVQLHDVESDDSLRNFYLVLSANTIYENVISAFNATSSTIAGSGLYLDGSSGVSNNSTRFKHVLSQAFGIAGITGLNVTGCAGDLFVDDFETSSVDTGINLNNNSGGASLVCGEDVHLNHVVIDTAKVVGIVVTSFSGGSRHNCNINDVYIDASTANAIGIDIESNSKGVNISNGEISMRGGATNIGVKINSSQYNTVSGIKFDMNTGTNIVLAAAVNNIIANNVFANLTGFTAAKYIDLQAGSNLNSIIGNQFAGFYTTAVAVAATALVNVIYPNLWDHTNGTNAVTIAAGAWGNITNGQGGSPPAVATCGTIGTNSTNSAGFVTSNVTGACTVVMTFDATRMGPAGVGWACHMDNSTHPTSTNIMAQTASTTTTATFTGTTVTGDVMPYICTAY